MWIFNTSKQRPTNPFKSLSSALSLHNQLAKGRVVEESMVTPGRKVYYIYIVVAFGENKIIHYCRNTWSVLAGKEVNNF